MTKRKAVTISITHAEFEAISRAFAEYIDKINSGANDDYIDCAIEDGEHFSSFEQKYWRAVQAQRIREEVKRLTKKIRERAREEMRCQNDK